MKTKFSRILTLLLVLVVQLSFAQTKTITGTVSDDAGLPLPGANVIIKGTSTGAQTDFDGNYSISANAGQVLVFSYIGFQNQEITVGTANSYNVTMRTDAAALEEVVVVGYGSQSKDKVIQNVAILGEETIEDLVVTSPDQLLQGQASGVQVVNNSGLLGSAAAVRIRGLGSINSGNSPLFVLDGIPLTDSGNTFGNGGNQAQNPLNFINPNDIESLTVLKDAAATAPYGTRGANGVILITTKKGRKNQDATVTINTYTQFSSLTDIFDVLTADEYRGFKSKIATIKQGQPVAPEDLNLGAFGDPGSDYVDAITRTGITHNYDFSVRGGSEKTTYFVGGTYADQESFSVGNTQERLSSRLNLRTEANDWLAAGMNIGITNTRLRVNNVENSVLAPLTSALLQNPTFPIRDEDGEFVPSPTFIANIVQVTALNDDIVETLRSVGNIFLEVSLAEGLTYKPEFGVDLINLTEHQRSPAEVAFGDNATLLDINERLFKVTNTLNYQTTFGENHNFSALALTEYEERVRRITQVTGTEFLSGDITNVGGATTQVVDAASQSGSRLFGILGQVRYDYDSKYLFEFSGRRDGSSRFGSNERFAYFYAGSAGWVLSKEAFLEDSNVISYLALRGSYGTSGNDRLGNFPSLGLNTSGQYNGNSTLDLSSAANANLGWEESTTLDVGIKSSFFNNRLDINLTYFDKQTDDLLLNQRQPPLSGVNSISANIGSLKNSGFELDINSVNIRTENFEWKSSLNISKIDNELLALNDEADIDDQGRRYIESGAQRAIIGESLSNFYLIRYVGINPQTGDAEWLDADGNVTNDPTQDDRVVVGSALPDFSGGFSNTFKYKNFDLSIFTNFSVGNDILVDGLRFIDGDDAIGGIGNVRSENLNIWEQPGDNAFLPSPNSTTFSLFNQRSTQQLKDASYFRLKNVTLGYTLPKKIFEKSNLFSSVRLYATATNLATIKGDDLKGIDPEVNDSANPLVQGETFFTAPQTKTYLFGATIQF